jgi:hypothetical protein
MYIYRDDDKELAEQRIRKLRVAWQEDLEDQLQRKDKIKDDFLVVQVTYPFGWTSFLY